MKQHKQNKNKKLFRILLIIFEISFFIFIIFFLFNLDKKGVECQIKPIPFAIEKLESPKSGMIYCTCRATNLQGELIFNRNGLVIQENQEFSLENLGRITIDNP